MKKNIALKNQSPIVRPYVKIDFQNSPHNILGIRTSFGVIFHQIGDYGDMLLRMQGVYMLICGNPCTKKSWKLLDFGGQFKKNILGEFVKLCFLELFPASQWRNLCAKHALRLKNLVRPIPQSPFLRIVTIIWHWEWIVYFIDSHLKHLLRKRCTGALSEKGIFYHTSVKLGVYCLCSYLKFW